MKYILIGLIDGNLPVAMGNLNQEGIGTASWDAIGDLLDSALKDAPEILASIKADDYFYLGGYSFLELNQCDFNRAITSVGVYIDSLEKRTSWQERGINAWQELFLPAALADSRYMQPVK